MASSARTYRLFPLAEADLEDIWRYTARTWSGGQAERYHASIVASFEGLADGSKQGRAVDVRDGYMKYAVGSHLIFYRVTDLGIDVVRVLHRRMDVDRHLT